MSDHLEANRELITAWMEKKTLRSTDSILWKRGCEGRWMEDCSG